MSYFKFNQDPMAGILKGIRDSQDPFSNLKDSNGMITPKSVANAKKKSFHENEARYKSTQNLIDSSNHAVREIQLAQEMKESQARSYPFNANEILYPGSTRFIYSCAQHQNKLIASMSRPERKEWNEANNLGYTEDQLDAYDYWEDPSE